VARLEHGSSTPLGTVLKADTMRAFGAFAARASASELEWPMIM
jgi:hypothetical protein